MTQWQSTAGSNTQTGSLTWNANGTLQQLGITDNFNQSNAQTCSYGYDDLARSALTYEIFGVELQAASLKDILRSKRASNRPQDQQDVIVIKEMLKRRQKKIPPQ